MALFRRRRAIAEAIATIGAVILARNVYEMAEKFVAAGVLTEDDIDSLDYELAPFELAVWFELFLAHLGSRDEDTMGRLSAAFGTGLQMAHLSEGYDGDAAITQSVDLVSRMSDVLVGATLRQARTAKQYDRFFLLAFGLVSSIVGEAPAREDAERVAQIQAIARSVVDAATATFAELSKDYRLVL